MCIAYRVQVRPDAEVTSKSAPPTKATAVRRQHLLLSDGHGRTRTVDRRLSPSAYVHERHALSPTFSEEK